MNNPLSRPLSTIAAAVRRAFAPAAPRQFAAPGAMTREQAAMEQVFGLIATMPDPDEALRRAGITRAQLRAVEMDDEVTAALDTRREAVVGTPWRLEGGAARWREELRAELAPHMEALLRGAFAAVPYGYSVLEVVYRNDGGGSGQSAGQSAGIARVIERPFEHFTPQADGITAHFLAPDAPPEGRPMDPRKCLLTVRQPSARNPYGEALLSRAYWPWFFRQHGWQYWMRWLERYGTPMLLAKTSGDVDKMAQSLAAAQAGSVLAVGMGDEVQAMAAATGTAHFSEFDAILCRRFQKLILGQTLTTDASSGGSYSAAKVADAVRQDRRNADLRLVAATVQRLVDALWQFNARAGAAPRFVMADDTGLERGRAERDAILTEKVGVRLTPEYVANAYDLEPGDFTMTGPAQDGPQDARQGTQKNGAGAPDEPEGGAGQGAGKFSAAGAGQARKYSAVQQGIEDGLQRLEVTDPIDPELIRRAVLAARDEEDLRQRLALLVDEIDPRFAQALERASFAAAVLGYVAADEQRT